MLCQVKHFSVLFAIISMTLQNLMVASYQLCVNETVSVKPNSSGTIEYQHANRGNLDSCTLTLTGFKPRSHISLPSVQVPRRLHCPPDIIINNQLYCVNEKTDNPAIIQTNGTLTIKLNTPSSNNFTFHYYGNVAECGQEAVISDVSQVSQLSGVLASRYGPSRTARGQCQINISVVGRAQFTARLENLFTTGVQVKLGSTTLGGEKGNTTTVSSDDGKIVLTVFAESYTFLIKYSVLHCGPVPQVNNTIPPPGRLRLVGSHVTYSCVEGYRLNYTTKSTRTCEKEDGAKTGGKWSRSNDISCVPGEENSAEKGELKPVPKDVIIIAAPVGGLVALAVIVGVVVYCCLCKRRSTELKPKRSENDNNSSTGAYAITELQPQQPTTSYAIRNPNIADRPAAVVDPVNQSAVYGHINKSSRIKKPMTPANVQADNTHEESPALLPKPDVVVFEKNDLYEGQGNLAASLNRQQQVEMFDNELYGTG